MFSPQIDTVNNGQVFLKYRRIIKTSGEKDGRNVEKLFLTELIYKNEQNFVLRLTDLTKYEFDI